MKPESGNGICQARMVSSWIDAEVTALAVNGDGCDKLIAKRPHPLDLGPRQRMHALVLRILGRRAHADVFSAIVEGVPVCVVGKPAAFHPEYFAGHHNGALLSRAYRLLASDYYVSIFGELGLPMIVQMFGIDRRHQPNKPISKGGEGMIAAFAKRRARTSPLAVLVK